MKQRPITVFAFLAPSLVGLTVFFLVPFLDVVRRSFLSASGERFAGWDNYAAVLGNEAFLLAAGNTAKFMLACIPVLLALSLALALAVRESTPFRRLAKTALLVPCAVPVYAAALLAGLAFDARGMVNGVLAAWNVHPVAWLTSDAAFWVLVASYVWRNLGYCVVLWLAALSCIPEHVFEAARIDGARPATVLRRVRPFPWRGRRFPWFRCWPWSMRSRCTARPIWWQGTTLTKACICCPICSTTGSPAFLWKSWQQEACFWR